MSVGLPISLGVLSFERIVLRVGLRVPTVLDVGVSRVFRVGRGFVGVEDDPTPEEFPVNGSSAHRLVDHEVLLIDILAALFAPDCSLHFIIL